MTPVKTMDGTKLLVQIGNGGTPTETFAHDCLINTERGIQFQAETNRQTIPDCDNPEAPSWSAIMVDGKSATITGSGMLHTPSLETWFNWFDGGDNKNVRVLENGVSAANGGGYFAGAFKCTNLQVNGQRNEKATVSVTLESDGIVTWTDAAA